MSEFQTSFTNAIKQNAGIAIGLGIIMMIVGVLAMAAPLVAGLSVAMVVGLILLIGGIAQLVFAIKAKAGLLAIIFAVLTVAIGGYMIGNADVALATLTIFLAVYFVFSGILEMVNAFQIKPASGWGWAWLSGLISVLLGAMIWSQFPVSGIWAVGILIGVRLLFSGLTMLMVGIAARSAS